MSRKPNPENLLTACGKTQHILEWSRERGIGVTVIYRRLREGWSVEEAVTLPGAKRSFWETKTGEAFLYAVGATDGNRDVK